MSERIIRGYWDCPYCDSKDIDGLVDDCPNCGRHKPENVKYHLKGKHVQENKIYNTSQVNESDVLSTEELHSAGISEEECDGNHKEWVCSYCNSLNNWADDFCSSCGSPKEEANLEYGMQKREKIGDKPEDYVGLSRIDKEVAGYIKEKLVQKSNFDSRDSQEITTEHVESSKKSMFTSKLSNALRQIGGAIVNNALQIMASLLFLIFAGILFFPRTDEVTVTGFHWERNISIEDYRTVRESDWSVPPGGRAYSEQTELKGYVSVIDHYRTVTETKSRQVIDHYETNYTYSDNGNGTFTEHSSQTPVYRTEYYEETHEEPVYRQDPVYATKYYYEIERWLNSGRNYPSSGDNHEPYWNTEYTLADNERDTDRTEKYVVMYDNGKSDSKTLDDWLSIQIGDKYKRTYCLLFTYKTEELR